MIKKIICFVLIAFCFVGQVECFPALTGRVVDNASILTQQQKRDLIQILGQAEPHQVVAVSLDSLEGQEIEDYGYQLGRYWGIGRKDINDGVLVLIAPNERQLRIEVGYGLEGVLTDALCSEIVNKIMLPLAREGKYDEALIQGATAVVQVLGGQFDIKQHEIPSWLIDILFMLILLLCIFGFFCGGVSGSGFSGGGFSGGGGSFGGGGASGRF